MKGIAIIAVIAGHVLPLESHGRIIIYSFHMPLFFIVAGYLYKPNTMYRKRFRADFFRLMIPYLVFAFCFTIYLLIKETDKLYALKYSFIATVFGSSCNHLSLIWSTAPRIGAAWFLPALFCCRQIFNLIYNHTKFVYIVIPCITVISILIDNYLINLPFALLPGISATIFYLIGYLVHSKTIEDKYYLIFGFVGFVCWMVHIMYSNMDMSFCYYGLYPVDVIGASFATAAIYFVSRWLSKYHIGKVLGRIGEASLYIFCFHALEAEVKPYQWLQLGDRWYEELIIRATWCIAVGYAYFVLKKHFKKV